MTGNQLVNAGFQDGVTGWIGSGGTVLSVDDSVLGYEGRLVLKASKNVANAENISSISHPDYSVEVEAGETLEVFAHHAFTRGLSYLRANFYVTKNGVLLPSVPITLVSQKKIEPKLGLSQSFDFSHSRIVVPDTATYVRLSLMGTASSAGVGDLLLMKPYLEVLPSHKAKYRCWDPGPSINPDLNIPHWPSELPHIKADNFAIEPIPTRRGFVTDSGVEISQKLVNVPWYRAQVTVAVNQETQTILDQFFRNTDEFWFIRPDTLQLCQATWLANGEPAYSGLGPDRVATVSLQIRVL